MFEGRDVLDGFLPIGDDLQNVEFQNGHRVSEKFRERAARVRA